MFEPHGMDNSPDTKPLSDENPGGRLEVQREVSGDLYQEKYNAIIPPGESEREKQIQAKLAEVISAREAAGTPLTGVEKHQLEYQIRKEFTSTGSSDSTTDTPPNIS